MFDVIENKELDTINGGCCWCYVGAVCVIAGGFLTGGILGGAVAAVGVVGVACVE